ncbi:hypothetical protein CD798_03335 [Bacillaceae bacterium SAOS 7]|nr:hypothetical protein CD798_03335 [Bacillaceae bacterium SAOS 7]
MKIFVEIIRSSLVAVGYGILLWSLLVSPFILLASLAGGNYLGVLTFLLVPLVGWGLVRVFK